MSDDFFIGWRSAQDLKINSWVKIFSVLLLIGLLISSFVLVNYQKKFGDGVFEYGNQTEISGTYFGLPYPTLVYNDQGISRSALLFDFGKLGAQNLIADYEKQNNTSLHGKTVRVKGTRIYRNNYFALELTDGVESILSIENSRDIKSPNKKYLGQKSVIGEIADPKCFLGVMKPGYDKPHRSCAIRCISGGIPPILRQILPDGKEEYYVITGQSGRPINNDLLPYIADEVRLCGTVYMVNGWKTIEIDPEQDIQVLRRHWEMGDVILCGNR